MEHRDRAQPEGSEAAESPRRAVVAVLLGLLLALPAVVRWQQQEQEAPAAAAAAPARARPPLPGLRLADFRGERPSPDARLLADWIASTHANGRRAFILVDKKDARAWVFTPDARLRDSAPVLLGEARGDEILPGSGDKDPSQMRPEEKITPAGRFLAKPGVNADGEDVIWVDYADAISMHRIRPFVEQEHRLERLASLGVDDNRISFGCINLPVSFYEDVARPAVERYGALIYVLPDVRTVQQVFGAFDVTDPAQVAAARQAPGATGAATQRNAAAAG